MNHSLLTAARAAVRSSVVAVLGVAVLPAQTAPVAESEAKKDEAPQQIERFVVTGSYIPSTEMAVDAGASPVTRIDRHMIEQGGYGNTTELLQQVTVANANSIPISNNATGFTPGASAVSLRGLGPEATLVLINGRRVAAYPVGAGGSTAFVDLNSIPLAAIDKIEILKDGASAIYGADAVAGVINIKLRRGMSGSEAFVSYGNTTDKDSAEIVGSAIVGATNDKLTAIVGANYYHKGAIMNHDRDYSATPPFLSTNSSPANLELSRFAVSAALGQALTAPIPGVPNTAVFFYGQSGATPANNGALPASRYTYSFDRTATYNFNETSMSYPEVKRMGAFGSAERKVFGTDNVKGYVDFSYQNVRIENQLAPSATGDFSTPGQPELVIPARTANPILTIVVPALGFVQQVAAGTPAPRGSFPGPGTQFVNGTVQRLAAAGASNPFNPFNQDISGGSRARLAEFGNRIFRNETDAFMVTSGLKAENFKGHWNFDASVSFSSITDHTRNRMNSGSRFNQIVNANSSIFDPRSGSYLGTTTPYNPFGYYRNPIPGNAAFIDYARVEVKDTNESTLGQLNFVLSTSELWRLPGGFVGLAVGGDFRREQLDQEADSLAAAGDLVGDSPRASTNAQRKIGGVFAEVRVPVAKPLEVSASIRHERFFSSHRDTTVPKIALRITPLGNQLTLRSSFSRGFREPSLYELYSTPISALYPVQDPRDGFIEPETPITLKGNRRLQAERTNYFNAGFVWSPTVRPLKGLALGVDHWRIQRHGTVEANPQNTVWRAFGVLPGGLTPGESVFLDSSGFISQVNTVFRNVGRTYVDGWDFSAGYQFPTDRLGRWEVTTVWSMFTRYDRASVENAPLQNVIGLDSTGLGEDGYLKWKGRVNLLWAYKGFTVYTAGNYLDGFADTDVNGNPAHVASTFMVQAQVSYAFRATRGPWLRDTKVAVGARNLFDRDPPHASGSGSNTTGYPGSLYTAEGRFWYVSLDRKF
jgi:iron complex outermembrane recepter protein